MWSWSGRIIIFMQRTKQESLVLFIRFWICDLSPLGYFSIIPFLEPTISCDWKPHKLQSEEARYERNLFWRRCICCNMCLPKRQNVGVFKLKHIIYVHFKLLLLFLFSFSVSMGDHFKNKENTSVTMETTKTHRVEYMVGFKCELSYCIGFFTELLKGGVWFVKVGFCKNFQKNIEPHWVPTPGNFLWRNCNL